MGRWDGGGEEDGAELVLGRGERVVLVGLLGEGIADGEAGGVAVGEFVESFGEGFSVFVPVGVDASCDLVEILEAPAVFGVLALFGGGAGFEEAEAEGEEDGGGGGDGEGAVPVALSGSAAVVEEYGAGKDGNGQALGDEAEGEFALEEGGDEGDEVADEDEGGEEESDVGEPAANGAGGFVGVGLHVGEDGAGGVDEGGEGDDDGGHLPADTVPGPGAIEGAGGVGEPGVDEFEPEGAGGEDPGGESGEGEEVEEGFAGGLHAAAGGGDFEAGFGGVVAAEGLIDFRGGPAVLLHERDEEFIGGAAGLGGL